MANEKSLPRGGHGGSTEIVGGSGIAEGGNGGRGGAHGHARGGDGGCGRLLGSGYVRGGDGGDAGRPARPALGAPSPVSYTDPLWRSLPGIVDIYGIPQPGKGGDSHQAYVIEEGRKYCLNIVLRLLDGPLPKIVEISGIIDAIDTRAHDLGIGTEQEWWNLAVHMYPDETAKIIAHMRACEEK